VLTGDGADLGSSPVDVKALVSDEAALSEALRLAQGARFEFLEHQGRLLGGKQQLEAAGARGDGTYVLRVGGEAA
jgi:hypothetical protein